ncbi:MAG: toprim domain-containing protein [Gammaproteobacteria bacterium]|nr:toprim domain-containing protein [Gammaproteobacteria bacterium]
MATKYFIEDHHLNKPKKEGKSIVAFCPFHNDRNTPNLHIFDDRKKFKCFAAHCGKGGSAKEFLKLTNNLPAEKNKKTGRPIAKPKESDVELLHKKLMSDEQSLKFLLEKRGWTKKTVIKFKLGLTRYDMISIPVRDFQKNLTNIRIYNIQKIKGSPKFRSWAKGLGSRIELFRADFIEVSPVYLFEGEPDGILAHQLKLNATAFTGGTESIKNDHLHALAGRDVVVVFDIDPAGKKAASKITRYLSRICTSVKNVYLPITEPPNGDFTNYILGHPGGHVDALKEFKVLVQKTPRYTLPTAERAKIAKMDPKPLLLEEACLAKNVGFKQEINAMVAGKDMEPFLIPKKILVSCGSADTNKKSCQICGLYAKDDHEINLGAYDPEILEIVGQSQDKVRGMFRRMADVHPRCTAWTIDIIESQNVESIIVLPEINHDTEIGRPYIKRTAYIVNGSVEANKSYKFVGWTAPDPTTHHVAHIMEKADPTISDIDSFELSPEMKGKLEVFQAIKSTEIEKKLDEIYSDFEDHVTHIWGRRDLLLVIDIAYHSAIRFIFDGKKLRRAWVEVLILGDTRQGKSESVEQLQQHYKAGEIISAENTSFSGLVGGIDIVGSRKYITWGKLPLNDGRLVIIDEFSEMDHDEIGRLSGVRSRGIAEITKIQTERTMARCRLIIVSNPRRLTISQFSPGVVAVKDLIGKVEDIARFDMAITLASNEVSPKEINVRRKPRAEHKYTSELCTNRLRWVWSRGEKYIFQDRAVDAILEHANDLAKKYHPAIPLVEPSEVRIKLARISASIAGMVCSTEDWDHILVTEAHAYLACKFLVESFNKPSMRYDEFSSQRFKEESLDNPDAVKRKLSHLGLDIITDMMDIGNIQLKDLEDWCDDRKEAQQLISYLRRARCLKKPHSFYVKTPAFNDLLRSLKENLIDGVSFKEEEELKKGQEKMPF